MNKWYIKVCTSKHTTQLWLLPFNSPSPQTPVRRTCRGHRVKLDRPTLKGRHLHLSSNQIRPFALKATLMPKQLYIYFTHPTKASLNSPRLRVSGLSRRSNEELRCKVKVPETSKCSSFQNSTIVSHSNELSVLVPYLEVVEFCLWTLLTGTETSDWEEKKRPNKSEFERAKSFVAEMHERQCK